MTLLEKSKKLVELRQAISVKEKELDDLLQPLKQERDGLQNEVLEELKATEQFSARFDFGTITRAVRKTTRVIDENAVFQWLEGQGLKKEYTEERVVLLPQFEALVKQVTKEGKTIDGLEVRETEYISIRSAEEGTEKRKITLE